MTEEETTASPPQLSEKENNSPKEDQTPSNNFQSPPFGELFGDEEASPEAALEPFANEKHAGRLRKNEQVGIYGDLPIRDVIRFRHVNGRHIEGMSSDMQEEYDYWYFTRPNKAKDGKDYERHLRSWKRREKWLADLLTTGSTRNSPVTDLSQERQRRRR